MRELLAASELPEFLTAHFVDDLEWELRNATVRVLAELKSARFALDSAGDPADEGVREALGVAVVMQLEYWAETGDSTGAAAQAGGGSIMSVSLPSGKGSTSVADKQASRIAPAVAEFLRTVEGIDWTVSY